MTPLGSPSPKKAALLRSPSPDPVLVSAIRRMGLPLFIFGSIFFLISVALQFIVSPDRFPVRMGDKTVPLIELEEEEKRLRSRQAELLETRARILASSNAPVLLRVERLREDILPVGAALLAVEDMRSSFGTGGADPIALARIDFAEEKIVLGGDVRDTAGRSIQILASFVDGLRTIPFLSSVSEPEYRADPLDGGGTIAPFSLTLTLRHD